MECELKRIKIFYEIVGEGYPIIMIHGFEVDHRVMKGCMEPIFKDRSGYKRIYFDLPGMGNCEAKSWITSSDQMLEIVIEFIDKIIPNQNFVIVSESYGCYLARAVIFNKLQYIDGVAFICPVIYANANNRIVPKHVVLTKDSHLLQNLALSDRKEFGKIAVIQNQRVWERFRDEFYSGVKCADIEFLSRIWTTAYSLSFDVDKKLKLFEKPTLFLMGRQDSIVGYQDAWDIIEKYPRASFVILDQAGHLLQIEKEELFNSLMNDWLDRVEQAIL